MFTPGTSIPKLGEIRLGYVEQGTPSPTHKYVGLHPYLVISNNRYNRFSGQCEVIPFTTKRFGRRNPAHVDFTAAEVDGLVYDSTLVVESRDVLLHSQLSEPVGYFTNENWQRVIPAILAQKPFMIISNIQVTQPEQVAIPC